MPSLRLATLLLALPLVAAAAEPGAEGRAGDVVIADAWARATLGPVRNSAAYMTLANHGTVPDRLIAAASPAARKAELHVHLHEGGIVRMRPVAAIEVAPGEATVLQPGGLHVMLVDLDGPLAPGDRLTLTLAFETGGPVTLELPVRGLEAGRHAH
jgi:periplasmic copper chaperone A